MNTLLTWAQNLAKKINIPKSLKTSIFVPIYKFWNSQTLNGFRTISLLPRFKEVHIVGDLNVDLIKKSTSELKQILHLMEYQGFQ